MNVTWHRLMTGGAVLTGFATMLFAGFSAPGAQISGSAPPKARYDMDVGTVSGMGGWAGAGAGDVMAAMFGGKKSRVSHELHLALGSALEPQGEARADHFLPVVAQLGPSVPLLAPQPGDSGAGPTEFERPKARLILFWGCGEKAGPGQPVIIDFASLAAGQSPPNLFTAHVPADSAPTAANSRTFGEWPNRKTRKAVPANSSLIGDHRIAATYAPEIRFALAQDYMPALQARSAVRAEGAVDLTWDAVANATGYYAWAMGAKGAGRDGPTDMVWWSSSSQQDFGGGLWGWLAPAIVHRLIGQKVVMPPTQTRCTMPAEVKAHAPDMMMAMLTAYGPEANFAFPPRPQTGLWRPDWTARVRFRSTTSMLIGAPSADGGAGMAGEEAAAEPKKKCRKVFGVPIPC